MKPVSLALALLVFLFGHVHGAEKVLFTADFTHTLAEPWGVLRGFWKTEDGVLRGRENPLETNAHHSASLRCFVPYGDAVLDYEIRFDGAKNHRLGINAAEKHRPLCFVDFQPGQLIIARESESGNPDEKAVIVARAPLALKAGEWYRVRVEFRGDALNVEIAGTKLSAKHEWIGRAKGVFKLYVSGDSASFRNLRLLTAEKEPNPAPERVPAGFLPLFDGESLKGWHTAPRLGVPATPAEAATAKTP